MKTKDECYREALDESPYGILTYETALRAMDKYAESYHKEMVNAIADEEIENFFTKEHYHYQKGRYTRVDKDRIYGAKWLKSKLMEE